MMMKTNCAEVLLESQMPKKIEFETSNCPILFPFSVFEEENFTVLTEFLTRNQLVSQLYVAYDTIEVPGAGSLISVGGSPQ